MGWREGGVLRTMRALSVTSPSDRSMYLNEELWWVVFRATMEPPSL